MEQLPHIFPDEDDCLNFLFAFDMADLRKCWILYTFQMIQKWKGAISPYLMNGLCMLYRNYRIAGYAFE